MSQPSPAPRRRSPRGVIAASVAATVLGLAGIGYAVESGGGSTTTAASSTVTTQQPTIEQLPAQQDPTQQLPSQDGFGSFGSGDQGTTDGGSSTGTTTAEATDATAAQEVGLVYIDTTLDYGSGQAAGTGMILTSDGEILTNHHVVEGATSISVQVVSTGKTYDADVVGYDSTHDVAVLKLQDASGLTPVTTDTSDAVQAGDTVTGVGNANGDGGAASAAAGTVTALDQSITVSSETDGSSSRLSGLIQISADIIAGDSGGALYDADGEVIGMNTAASSGTTDVTGYAVPIGTALTIADQIESGTSSSTVQIGNHGFLGVELSSQDTGALVAGTVDDSPAAAAGITTGSTVTSIDGTTVTTAEELSDAIAKLAVGDSVTVTWTDQAGQSHSASITLGEGPIG